MGIIRGYIPHSLLRTSKITRYDMSSWGSNEAAYIYI